MERMIENEIGARRRLTEGEALRFVFKAFAVGMLQSGLEARDLAMWMSERNIANVLELGTCAGGMLVLMDRVSLPGLRISMDQPWELREPKLEFREMIRERFHAELPGLVEILGQIHDEAQRRRLEELLAGRKVDFMFIDADHTYDGAKKHFEMYSPFVRAGGYVGFHDLSNAWPCGEYVKTDLFPRYAHWVFEEAANLYGIGTIQLP